MEKNINFYNILPQCLQNFSVFWKIYAKIGIYWQSSQIFFTCRTSGSANKCQFWHKISKKLRNFANTEVKYCKNWDFFSKTDLQKIPKSWFTNFFSLWLLFLSDPNVNLTKKFTFFVRYFLSTKRAVYCFKIESKSIISKFIFTFKKI